MPDDQAASGIAEQRQGLVAEHHQRRRVARQAHDGPREHRPQRAVGWRAVGIPHEVGGPIVGVAQWQRGQRIFAVDDPHALEADVVEDVAAVGRVDEQGDQRQAGSQAEKQAS